MSKFGLLDRISLVAVVVGSVNLGFKGLGLASDRTLEPAEVVLGGYEPLQVFFYLFVGLSGLYQIYFGYRLYED